MTDKAQRATFLEREGYRRRRLADAAFLLPVFGLLVFVAPVLWPLGSGADPGADPASTMPMSLSISYVFLAWGVLILCAAVLGRRARGLQPGPSASDPLSAPDAG